MKEFKWQTKESNFFNKSKTDWKLEVMFQALSDLKNPHLQIENKVIHVAGTNGKGSVASYIKTILEKSGYKVGAFTSPHLIEFNERIYANGRFIADDEIERYKQRILKYCSNASNISFFEAVTLIAILHFVNLQKKEGLDYFIFEVGLGGRLDATNVFNHPLASVITSISYDHMDKLGNSLRDITREKCGIIKPNVPVFTSNTKQIIIDEIRKISIKNHSKLYILGKDFNLDNDLKPSLQGDHQLLNATLAGEVCKYVGIKYNIIQNGISSTEWRCRLQKIEIKEINKDKLNDVDLYLDGAHNEDGVKVLCDFIIKKKNETNKKGKNQPNIIGIFSVLKRKDYQSFFPILQKVQFNKLLFFDDIQNLNDFVETDNLSNLANDYEIPNATINSFHNVNQYLKQDCKNIVFIFGSLYFAGWVLENYVIKSK